MDIPIFTGYPFLSLGIGMQGMRFISPGIYVSDRYGSVSCTR
jgi:hypothetical protein